MNAYSLLVLPITFLLAGTALAADDKACPPSDSAAITEANSRSSVLVPKSSGLGHDQSYDDIGCAVMARNEECATRQMMFDGAARVYDRSTGAELPAEKAYFVLKTDVTTPRGFGIVAFAEKAEAEKFSAAHGKGRVVRWFELVDEKLK